jgi:hypothetical protein
MDSPVVFRQLTGAAVCKAAHLIRLKAEVEDQVARYTGRVKFERIPRELNAVADALARDAALESKGARG